MNTKHHLLKNNQNQQHIIIRKISVFLIFLLLFFLFGWLFIYIHASAIENTNVIQPLTLINKHSVNHQFSIKTVVIDPGHGGKDPGAVGKISYEKDIVLNIALKLGRYIENNFKDIKVVYTRKTDKFVELHKRAMIANANKADLFISIHANASLKETTNGMETYVMGLHTSKMNWNVAKRENSVVVYEKDYSKKYENYNPNSPASFIAFSLMQEAYLKQSMTLAQEIQNQLLIEIQRKDGGIRQAGFLVLWDTSMPGVLVETGYISNTEEEKYINTGVAQQHIAFAIYKAFCNYKTIVESKSSFIFAENINEKENKNALNTENKKDTKANKNSKIAIIDTIKSKKTVTPVQKTDVTDVYFAVQVYSKKEKLPKNHKIFKRYKNVNIHKIGNNYKYTIGRKTKYMEIVKLKMNIRKTIPEAFTVAFKKDKPLSVQEAIKITAN